ncbi:hypothetical protein GCM10011289_26840 [Paludibacterium paludis]|uniref:Uncharacterized protein n=1 Tax=Paludibacterium paludis TaxID=1225769 RepID=A0A918P5H9_9NEIS|nr:hypothetical protein [Paludibacterium paludis]GGY21755.1 hypothetical protein GCM10011289_26840 [Paludibacterium paludis]
MVGGLAGCATNKPIVLRYETGMVAQFYADSPDDAEKATIKAAEAHCAKLSKEVVVVKMDTGYRGKTDETVNKALNAASSNPFTPPVIKPFINAFSEKNPYSTTLTFRCE